MDALSLNQERKDEKTGRIVLKKKEGCKDRRIVFEPGKEGY